MASSANLAAALILLLTLSSTAVHGRDSHFFSKVAADTNPTTTTVTVSPDARTPVANPNNVVDPNAFNNNQQQQQPSFVQEADNNGYGIYGHLTPEETTPFDQTAGAKLTASPTTNSYLPYNAQGNSDQDFRNQYSTAANNNNDDINSEKYYNNDRYYGQSGYNGDNNNDEFQQEEPQEQSFGGTSQKQQEFSNGFQTDASSGSGGEFGNRLSGAFGTSLKQQEYSNGFQTDANSGREFGNGLSGGFENSAAAKGFNSYNNYDNKINGKGAERQGMSDTRYMEGGKYYFDVNKAANQNQQVNQNGYYSNSNDGDIPDSYRYANAMSNRDQQQPAYYHGDSYQNLQYDP